MYTKLKKILIGTMVVTVFVIGRELKARQQRSKQKNAILVKHAALIKYFKDAFPYY